MRCGLALQPTSPKRPWHLGSGMNEYLGMLTAEYEPAIMCGGDDRLEYPNLTGLFRLAECFRFSRLYLSDLRRTSASRPS